MSLVDLYVIAAAAVGIFIGRFVGATVTTMFLVGFGLGVGLTALISPAITALAGGMFGKTVVSMFVMLAATTGMSVAGWKVARRLLPLVHEEGLARADRVAGGFMGGLVAVVGVWLVGSAIALAEQGPVARSVQRSAILSAIDAVLPPVPNVITDIGRTLDVRAFPPVFSGFEPPPPPSVPLPGQAAVEQAADAARASTVRVIAPECGSVGQGTGFAVGGGFVVTNAHVVAGNDEPMVADSEGRHRAIPVVFDPELDLAILRVRDLAAPPLRIRNQEVGRGTTGAVLGYAGGTEIGVVPAAVLQRFTATGRDIYGRGQVTRELYQLSAEVEDGFSGGPFVDTGGGVLGVVFSHSLIRPDIAYALPSTVVAEYMAPLHRQTPRADTGECDQAPMVEALASSATR